MILDYRYEEGYKMLFDKCKKDKGTIYLIEFQDYNEWGEKWKYGKSKNLKKRLTFYPENIKLLYNKEVDFLSTREELCHWRLNEDYKELHRGTAEYCIRNPLEVIKNICESEVILTKEGALDFIKNNELLGWFGILTMLEKMTFKTK